MTRFSTLLLSNDYRVRMIAVRRRWALEWRKEGELQLAANNFKAAHQRLWEVRHEPAGS